ncbi:MAG: 30S ribosomal protein S12 methylthiotransferase RimO [Spirochaetales bacterium]|nr:30S ribosomal protein S12 methylthiotransferase RimO [Spirochaetales bacterium]
MSKPINKTFYIEHLGCAKNQVDAEVLTRYLEDDGWSITDTPEEAAFLIVNSCAFIQPAREETIATLFDLRNRFPDKRIILAGCFAQRYGTELSALEDTVDGIFGNGALSRISWYLDTVLSGEKKAFTGTAEEEQPLRKRLFSFPRSAYVKISEGCDNRCAFCSIPLIRGPLRSRKKADILKEVRDLLDRGIFELNLIGQDLGSFGRDTGEGNIADLLSDITRLRGDFWVRLLYIHPDNFPEQILEICREDPRILPYFDIPFQHGSPGVLQKMGRRGTAGDYLNLADRIRTALPGAVLRTTFLVGFPGETREAFAELVDFQRRLQPDWLGVFTWSREEGTAAASMSRFTAPSRKTAEARREALMAAQENLTAEAMKRFLRRELPVLVEEPVTGEDLALGRIYAQAPEVDGLTVIDAAGLKGGDVTVCRITGVRGYDLEALPVGGRA